MKHLIYITACGFWCVLVLLTASLVTSADAQAQSRLSSTPNVQSAQPSKPATPLPTAESTPCPSSGISPQPITTSHHKVMLSWNPSPLPSHGQSEVAGYCLYRTKSNQPQKIANCAACEQINAFAFGGVSCVDSVVEDNAKYQYVVAAVDKNGTLSSPSNWAPAPIPDAEHAGPGHFPTPPPPACPRAPNSSQSQKSVR
jgi:hypothetical protein